MSRADELYVTNHNMPVLPLRNAGRCSGSEALPLPIIVDPIGISPITDIRFTVAGALDPESAEFSVADSGDGVSGRGAIVLSPDGALSRRANPASADAGFGPALPVYTLQETGGRNAACLKTTEPDGGPTGHPSSAIRTRPFPTGIVMRHRSSASRAAKRPYLPAVSIAFFDVAKATDAKENTILHRASGLSRRAQSRPGGAGKAETFS